MPQAITGKHDQPVKPKSAQIVRFRSVQMASVKIDVNGRTLSQWADGGGRPAQPTCIHYGHES